MARILIVDDDLYIRELINAVLKLEKFSIIEAIDGEDALDKLSETKIDLCIIDIMMPKMDGFELCNNIRQFYEDMPVLMLTAKGNILDKVKGFDKGTDDYLTKPFENEELVARVKALLRRYNIEKEKIVVMGNVIIDAENYKVKINNESIDLPLKEFELLFKLASSKGKTIPRETLINDIWGFDFDGNERTLDVHINRLRDKFKTHLTISTIRGLGYRMEETNNEE